MNISAKQLQCILSMSKDKKTLKDCKKIIYIAIQKDRGETVFFQGSENNTDWESVDSYRIESVSKQVGIDLGKTISDIQKNFLKSPQTRGWITNYPSSAISRMYVEKPITIKLPKVVTLFLPQGEQEFILEKWRERYNAFKIVTFSR